MKFNLRFPDQYYDELTKQHYNHNRFYNPALGRYVEPDRIELEGGLNPYIYADGNPVGNVDPSGSEYRASKNYSLGGSFTTRLDYFSYKNETRHEFHIFNKGKEVGIFSEGTFFNKHGKVMDIPSGFSPSNMSRIKGLAIEILRKMNRFPVRGTADIKDLNYRDKILDPSPRHATTNFENFSKTGKVLGYFGIGFIKYELYRNPNYTIDDAFIDVSGISRLGDSSLFRPSITFPADNRGNTDFYYHNYRN